MEKERSMKNLLNEVVARIKYDVKERGFIHTIRFILTLIAGLITYPTRRARRDTFLFNGNIYEYFYHWYNITHMNERCVEIPIIKAEIDKVSPDRVLEIGNVLRHYFPVSHVVVDKYEKGEGVINSDIMEYQADRKYDLIVSISTIEHIGWDERPQMLSEAQKAIEKLKGMLGEGGTLLITIPVGYNPHLDLQIKNGDIIAETFCMIRTSRNRWRQKTCKNGIGTQYGNPYPYANAITILIYQHKEKV